MQYKKECWSASDVLCPFYISDDRAKRSITCEGHTDGSTCKTIFRTLDIKNKFMGKHCVVSFELCPHYQTVCREKYTEA